MKSATLKNIAKYMDLLWKKNMQFTSQPLRKKITKVVINHSGNFFKILFINQMKETAIFTDVSR